VIVGVGSGCLTVSTVTVVGSAAVTVSGDLSFGGSSLGDLSFGGCSVGDLFFGGSIDSSVLLVVTCISEIRWLFVNFKTLLEPSQATRLCPRESRRLYSAVPGPAAAAAAPTAAAGSASAAAAPAPAAATGSSVSNSGSAPASPAAATTGSPRLSRTGTSSLNSACALSSPILRHSPISLALLPSS